MQWSYVFIAPTHQYDDMVLIESLYYIELNITYLTRIAFQRMRYLWCIKENIALVVFVYKHCSEVNAAKYDMVI